MSAAWQMLSVTAKEEGRDGQYDKYHEYHFRNRRGTRRDSAKSEYCSNDCNNKKYDRVM